MQGNCAPLVAVTLEGIQHNSFNVNGDDDVDDGDGDGNLQLFQEWSTGGLDFVWVPGLSELPDLSSLRILISPELFWPAPLQHGRLLWLEAGPQLVGDDKSDKLLGTSLAMHSFLPRLGVLSMHDIVVFELQCLVSSLVMPADTAALL